VGRLCEGGWGRDDGSVDNGLWEGPFLDVT
jgi:hypothetical protein